MDRTRHREDDLLRDRLDTGGDVGVVLVLPRQLVVVRGTLAEVGRVPTRGCKEVRPRVTRGAEERLELAAEGLMGRVVEGEVVHVELKAAVRLDADELPHLVDVAG